MSLNGATKNLQKHYAFLTPKERFRLVLSALARNDDQERQALLDACPRYQYLMTDHDYSNQLSAARQLVDMVIFDLLTLTVTFAVAEFLDLADPDQENFILVETAAAKWAALKRFCEGEGFDFDEFIIFSVYGLSRKGAQLTGSEPDMRAVAFEMVLKMLGRVDPPPALVERYQADISYYWQWATGPEGMLI